MYDKDRNYDDLLNECEHLKHYMAFDENCETLRNVQKYSFRQFEICIPEC